MNSRKSVILATCVSIIVLLSMYFVSNTPLHLEGEIRYTKQRLSDLVLHEDLGIQDLAASIHASAQSTDTFLWYSRFQSNCPEELQHQLSDFLNQSKVEIDSVYVGGQTLYIYPEGACVFRCIIEQFNGVYAWVDLVYAPCLEGQEQGWYKDQSKHSEQISPQWYISVLYGF